MPKTNKIIQSLNSGELSPLMDMRIDQDKYQMGCRTMENFYPLIYGGAERRPGTYYVATSKVDGDKIRLVDFVYSVDQSYIMEFGEQYIRFYANNGRFVGLLRTNNAAWADGVTYYAGDFAEATHSAHAGGSQTDTYRCLITHTSDTAGGDGTGGSPANNGNTTQWENATDTTGALTSDLYPIYEIQTPYITEDLFQLKFEQSADVMYITHPDYEPRKLSRISTTTFVLEELDYRDGPFQDINDVSTAKIAVSAVTGDGITLTASGTNADGTTFEPFKSGTGVYSSGNGGHAPSGATGAAAVGTSQTLPSITGALFSIIHQLDDNQVRWNFPSNGSNSRALKVFKGSRWDWVINGIWDGTLTLQRSYDDPDGAGGATWEDIYTASSTNNNNVQIDGVEELDVSWWRTSMTAGLTGSAIVTFTVLDSQHVGVVEITSVSSGTSAIGNVRNEIGDTSATSRWQEGYWSNYRGWPNSVAISSEERLTFAGSPSFPLTVWGSVSGDYTSMLIGVLDDDALIFTLVGSGRQNEILWIASKDALILGTHGGEHVLGASDDNEAMTPTNVRARIQSTYGSKDIQGMQIGDSILYWQRGGRKLREMHYDFAKDAQVSDDLTVFSNHITESSIVEMAYQRIPDPMVWAVRDDGQLAVMSYERAQDVYSWCRVWTATNTGAGTAQVESDIESVAVIPKGDDVEEEQVWISVERVIPGVNSGNPVRYIEYFSTRDY